MNQGLEELEEDAVEMLVRKMAPVRSDRYISLNSDRPRRSNSDGERWLWSSVMSRTRT